MQSIVVKVGQKQPIKGSITKTGQKGESGGIPDGGAVGATLVKRSAADQDGEWQFPNFFLSFNKTLDTPIVMANGQSINVFDYLTEDDLAAVNCLIGESETGFTLDGGNLKFPAIHRPIDYALRLQAIGTFSGSATAQRVIKYHFKRFDSSLTSGTARVVCDADSVTIDSISTIETYTNTVEDPFFTIGTRWEVHNTSDRVFTVTGFKFLAKGS